MKGHDMQKISFPEFDNRLTTHGRCYSGCKAALWFNWTCSGFSVSFKGSSLKASLVAVSQPMTAPFPHDEVILSPVIAIHTDGGPQRKYKLCNDEEIVELYSGDFGEHTVTVRKLSENVMGKCGVCFLETDGEFLTAPEKPTVSIELVGDSITCGYGNESTEDGLRTEEENGEKAYGFLAAEALGAEYSSVCVTGCNVTESPFFPLENRGMDTMYPFTDAPMDRYLGNSTYEPYDFDSSPKDLIVINYGTNDAHDVGMAGFTDEAHKRFRTAYKALIADVRRLNGKNPFILCTLGSMDYYLWEDILISVSEYTSESGDTKIVAKRLGCLDAMVEGIGADGHPSLKTHERMGRELAAIIKSILK